MLRRRIVWTSGLRGDGRERGQLTLLLELLELKLLLMQLLLLLLLVVVVVMRCLSLLFFLVAVLPGATHFQAHRMCGTKWASKTSRKGKEGGWAGALRRSGRRVWKERGGVGEGGMSWVVKTQLGEGEALAVNPVLPSLSPKVQAAGLKVGKRS